MVRRKILSSSTFCFNTYFDSWLALLMLLLLSSTLAECMYYTHVLLMRMLLLGFLLFSKQNKRHRWILNVKADLHFISSTHLGIRVQLWTSHTAKKSNVLIRFVWLLLLLLSHISRIFNTITERYARMTRCRCFSTMAACVCVWPQLGCVRPRFIYICDRITTSHNTAWFGTMKLIYDVARAGLRYVELILNDIVWHGTY